MALAEAPAAAAPAEAADGMVWADAGARAAPGGGSNSDDEEGGLAAYADDQPADVAPTVSGQRLTASAMFSCRTAGCCSQPSVPSDKGAAAPGSRLGCSDASCLATCC